MFEHIDTFFLHHSPSIKGVELEMKEIFPLKYFYIGVRSEADDSFEKHFFLLLSKMFQLCIPLTVLASRRRWACRLVFDTVLAGHF